MNQRVLVIIGVISVIVALAVAIAVVRSNPPSVGNAPRAKNNHSPVNFSEDDMVTSRVTPPADLPTGARYIDGTSVMVPWLEVQAPFIVSAKNLPVASVYVIETSTPHDFIVRFYPDIGEHYLLKSYDSAIIVAVHRSNLTPAPVSCTIPIGYEDLRDEEFHDGNYEIMVSNRLHYRSPGVEGGNPNPYTPELVEVILRTIRGLRIGNCK